MAAGFRLRVRGPAFEWRGPAPYVFVRVSDDDAELLRELSTELSYGWGCIRVRCRLGETTFTTSLTPSDGGYLVPLKVAARRPEGVEIGDEVELDVELRAVRARPAGPGMRTLRSSRSGGHPWQSGG